MTTALILKELRQHWLAFGLIAALAGVGLMLVTAFTLGQDSLGSTLSAFGLYLRTFYIIVALAICNRLVVREYQSKTQLFLLSLPVSRLQMVTVKYLFGLTLLLIVITGAFLFVLSLSVRSENLTSRFLFILTARGYAFAWCVYSCFFMMGLLGRYRVALYVFGFFGAFAVDSMTKFELRRFGPFALMNDQFEYERFTIPVEPLLVTLGITAAFILLSLTLALVREGSIASLLAEKMSHREKVLIVAILLCFLFGITVFDEQVKKKPFDIQGGVIAESGEVSVKVSLGASLKIERADRLAWLVATEVSELQEYLDIRELPPIFIVQRRDLDATRFERGVLDGAEGLLVRANFYDQDWDDRRFLVWLVRELLTLASDGRVEFEPNRWVLDGFALYWPYRESPRDSDAIRQLELRAAYGAQQGFALEDARNWLTYRERVGQDIASAVAWRAVFSMQESLGVAKSRGFLRTILDCNIPGDVRGVWREWRHPLPAVMKQETGMEYPEFVSHWSRLLVDLRESRADDLSSIPRLSATLEFEELSESSRVVMFEFESDPPPPDPGRFTMLHAELPAFDDEVPVDKLRREELLYERERSGDLPGSYPRGTRLYATFAVWVEQLGCEVISGWQRREMR